MLALLIPLALAEGPPDGAELAYELHRVVKGTAGAYEGWSEQLASEGRYTLDVDGDTVKVHAHYAWTYASTDGEPDRGVEDRDVRVDLATRRYLGRTDLDDYDDKPGPVATWLWIPTDVRPGDRVELLDHTYTVRALADRATPTARPGVLLVATGRDQRDDVYGRFTYTWEDRFWFDPATGMVLTERYTETDDGTWKGEPARFTWTEWLDVTEASYLFGRGTAPVPPGWDPELRRVEATDPADDGDDGGGVLLVLVLAVVALPVMLGLGRSVELGGGDDVDRYRSRAYGPVTVVKPGPTANLAAALAGQAATTLFAPWIDDLVARTLASGGVVAIAADARHRCVGVGLRDVAGPVGTILTRDAVVAELLRRELGLTSFFTEPTTLGDAPRAYNVHERLVVMSGPVPDARAWDRDLVGQMAPDELDEVVALAERALGEPCRAWIEASLAMGDLALVARLDDHVVGFGLASASGDHGRLHALVVAPDARNQGVGAELLRARLAALRDLGVQDVLVEVSADNAPMLHLLTEQGFRRVGELLVATTEERPRPGAWLRP